MIWKQHLLWLSQSFPLALSWLSIIHELQKVFLNKGDTVISGDKISRFCIFLFLTDSSLPATIYIFDDIR